MKFRMLVKCLFTLLTPLLIAAQETPPLSPASDQEAPVALSHVNELLVAPVPNAPDAQDQTLVYRAEPITDPTVFELSPSAKNFKFGNVDLELLKQVNAFDKYMEEHGLIISDPVVTGYVERIGRSVVPPNTLENVQWRFRVIRDPTPNAFALPNGSIYVNSGLLSRLQNQAQLAGVLAHESTHVFNRHPYTSYHDMRKKVVAIEVFQVGATAASFGGVNAGIVSALGNLIPMIVTETIFGYRRELEHESDVYAVKVMKAAGYDPEEMAKALDSLRNGPEVDLSQESGFWSDHPKLDDRIRDTSALAKEAGQPVSAGQTGEYDYVASTKNAVRHDAGLAMMLGRPRTAISIAERLIQLEPNNADNYALLGDGFRSLGARPAKATSEELTVDGRRQARKQLGKMTPAEYERALLAAPGGKEQFDANCELALLAYTKALALDPNNALATRGMGFLDEAQGHFLDAQVNFKKYLQLAPSARDARQVKQRLEKLASSVSATGAGQ
jgi:beta-barrel assembly-enhancing protease